MWFNSLFGIAPCPKSQLSSTLPTASLSARLVRGRRRSMTACANTFKRHMARARNSCRQSGRVVRVTSSCIQVLADHSSRAQIKSSTVVLWWPSRLGVIAVTNFHEMHLSDLEAQNSSALAQRIKALGGTATSYVGDADTVVDQVMNAINPYGLHLAFLDPFNLAQLPFSIIERMLQVQRMDMIIHVSLQDLQRNLDEYSRAGDPTLDNFAPGWRNAIDTRQSMVALRAALIEYWLAAIRALGTHPATGIPLIVGQKNQRLYWLVFLSSNPLGQKLWNDVQNLSGQGSPFFSGT